MDSTTNTPEPLFKLGAWRIIETAREIQGSYHQQVLGMYHLLMSLVQRHGAMAADLAQGLIAADLQQWLTRKLKEGESGAGADLESIFAAAQHNASVRGQTLIGERDLAVAILRASGYALNEGAATSVPTATGIQLHAPPASQPVADTPPALTDPPPATPAATPATPTPPSADGTAGAAGSGTPAPGGDTQTPSSSAEAGSAAPPPGSAPGPAAPANPRPPVAEAAAPPDASGRYIYVPRGGRPTPTLDKYGQDLTRAAQEGKLRSMLGRETEIEVMIEVLCRRIKRNPVLLGPAGVGKTALVEGLAQRIVSGQVPKYLQGMRLISLTPSAVVGGTQYVSQYLEKMNAILTEASQPGVILFIDEVHTLVGMGGSRGSDDMASLIKPVLARGEIACIAATTDNEWRMYFESDAALERRFQPIRVQELSPQASLEIIRGLAASLNRDRGIEFPDDVLKWLVDFAGRFLYNRHFPDKAVDLFEQCVAFAVSHDSSQVTREDAGTVAQRLVGMPLELGERLKHLEEKLETIGMLSSEQIDALLTRLNVTMRGLDVRQQRPNAVLLLIGEAAGQAGPLSQIIAETLFGNAERIVELDFSRMTEDHNISMLIGSPPGYVGYSDELPIHQLLQMPWSVVLAWGFESAHPTIRSVFAQALADGSLLDGRGRSIVLSEAVVVMASAIEPARARSIGFKTEGDRSAAVPAISTLIEGELGGGLASQVDILIGDLPDEAGSKRGWLEHQLLPELAERYTRQGLPLRFDHSLVEWLLAQEQVQTRRQNWERLLDEQIGPLLVKRLESGDAAGATLVVKFVDGALQVAAEDSPGEEGHAH